MATIIVFFDENCPLCRQLAAFVQRRALPGMRFCGWQSVAQNAEGREQMPDINWTLPANELRVWYPGGLLEGTAAWAFLIAQHPDLSALDWLARRLGLVNEAAQLLRGAAGLLRALCPRCPRRAPPGRA